MGGFRHLSDSVFGKDDTTNVDAKCSDCGATMKHDFAALNRFEKSAFIRRHASKLDELTLSALEYIGTVFLRSQCNCELLATYYDELAEEWRLESVYDEKKQIWIAVEVDHRKDCIRKLWPTTEDLDDSTIRRRRKRELLMEPYAMTFLEEQKAA